MPLLDRNGPRDDVWQLVDAPSSPSPCKGEGRGGGQAQGKISPVTPTLTLPLSGRGEKESALSSLNAKSNIAHALLRWDDVQGGLPTTAPGQHLGLLIPNTVRIGALLPLLPRLALIAITFPAYGDGRGFSMARQLRDAGFTGTLRASGPLIADQLAYALACGFDEIDLAEASAARQLVGQWLNAAGSMTAAYQRGYGIRPTILDQRRAARSATHV